MTFTMNEFQTQNFTNSLKADKTMRSNETDCSLHKKSAVEFCKKESNNNCTARISSSKRTQHRSKRATAQHFVRLFTHFTVCIYT